LTFESTVAVRDWGWRTITHANIPQLCRIEDGFIRRRIGASRVPHFEFERICSLRRIY